MTTTIEKPEEDDNEVKADKSSKGEPEKDDIKEIVNNAFDSLQKSGKSSVSKDIKLPDEITAKDKNLSLENKVTADPDISKIDDVGKISQDDMNEKIVDEPKEPTEKEIIEAEEKAIMAEAEDMAQMA